MRLQGDEVSVRELLSAALVAAVMGRWCWADRGKLPQVKEARTTMPNTHFCQGCDIYWSPHQTNNGACPVCGSGCSRNTMRKVSDEAYVYAELARVEREYREKCDRFDAYMAQRDAG